MSYHVLREASLAIKEAEEAKQAVVDNKVDSEEKDAEDTKSTINDMKDVKEEAEMRIPRVSNEVYNDLLGTAFKAIYVSALESTMGILSKNEEAIANHVVENYISEHGGAKTIISNNSGKTSLLDYVFEEVEDAHEEVMDRVEDDLAPDTDKSKEDMFDDMEKNGDVNDAVDIISARISDAEEEFIKKNAEDKKKVADIIDDINGRIEAVKQDDTISDTDKDQIEAECVQMRQRKINNLYDRPHKIFESMVLNTTEQIVRDDVMRESYMVEGHPNMDKIVRGVECLYGFLEFVNTVKLEKVDEEYTKRVIAEI